MRLPRPFLQCSREKICSVEIFIPGRQVSDASVRGDIRICLLRYGAQMTRFGREKTVLSFMREKGFTAVVASSGACLKVHPNGYDKLYYDSSRSAALPRSSPTRTVRVLSERQPIPAHWLHALKGGHYKQQAFTLLSRPPPLPSSCVILRAPLEQI